MKRIVGLLLLGTLSASAAGWFNARISGLESWPSDGSDLVVEGVGTWVGTAGAVLKGEAAARTLGIETTAEHPLTFTAAESRSSEAGEVTLSSDLLFSACPVLPDPTPYEKGALTVVSDENDALSYWGVAKDAAGGTNVWIRLTGAEAAVDVTVTILLTLRTRDGVREVRYAVGTNTLSSAAGEWQPLVTPADADAAVTGVGFSGIGTLSALRGLTTEEIVPVALTVPALDGMAVASVSVGGELVEAAGDGTYPVPPGAPVVVAFTAADGMFLDTSSMTFTMGAAAMTLPEDGRPTAVDARDVLSINEIMASNGMLATKNGGQELDWIEIRNTADFDVDITGWYLFDDPMKKVSKWTKIEGSGIVPANGYLIVWADKDYLGFAADEAYTRIGLSSSGEPLFLATPAGTKIHEIDNFGKQIKNVSYGRGSLVRTRVSGSADAEYRVGAGSWLPARGPVGMSAAADGFTVVATRIGKAINNMDEAEACLLDATTWAAAPVTNVTDTIAFVDGTTVSSTDFAYRGFPGVSGDNFIVEVTGTVQIPRAGLWTFSCGSDDGFSGTLSRLGASWTWENRSARSHAETYSTFSLPEAGVYALRLVYFEKGGGAALDVSVAEGDVEFDRSTFKLLGSVESGVIHAGSLGSVIAEDVEEQMKGVSRVCDWRTSFTLAGGLPETDALLLRLRYSDGFTAKLNGTVFATVPAPSAGRPLADVLAPGTFPIPADLVRAGGNVLEITGENNALADGDFLLAPEVVQLQHRNDFVYFETPTPGADNDLCGRMAPTPEVQFSVPHGYKTEAFELALSCAENPSAAIYYTLDGTSPTVESTRYTGPVAISRTTVVRAAAPDADSVLQCDTSATYLFVEDILTQEATPPAGFPATGAVNGQKMVYGMRSDIVAQYRDQILDGFTNSISTVSIVIDPKNLFDPSSGIYVNATGNGRAWERATMVEQISPTNTANEFSVPAGLRIRGAYSRGAKYPKHSFRLFFRSVYGASKLAHPLFGDEGADEFQKIDLRTSQNYSWANGSSSYTFIEDVWARDSQRALGQPYSRSRYYNLFINGVYWGLYQTEERVSSDYAASYFGGSELDYDVVRTSQPGYTTDVAEGTTDAWEAFWNMTVNEGYGSDYPNNYRKAMGLNPDGTRNPAYPVYLDPTNVISYMLTAHYAGDRDSPASSSRANNIAAFRSRVDGSGTRDGFVFNRHDAEHSLYTGYSDTSLYGTEAGPNGPNFRKKENFNPAEINYRLMENPEYRMLFADSVYRICIKDGGALTAPESQARFRARMAEIETAINCEAARWGAGKTCSTWQTNCGNYLGFMANRTPVLIGQYRALGWYPPFDPARAVSAAGAVLTNGTFVADGEQVYLTGGAAGTVYYTTDGTDPRLEGGAVSASAIAYTGLSPVDESISLFSRGSTWKYFDWGRLPDADSASRAWYETAYADSSWSSGAGVLGFANSGTFRTALSRYVNHATNGTQVTTFYLRKTFTAPASAASITELTVTDYIDDGYVLYLNGTEIARVNMPAGTVGYATYTSSTTNPSPAARTVTIPAGLLMPGENVLAAELHQCNASSTDAVWDMGLAYTMPGTAAGGLEVPSEGLALTTRVRAADGTWSALERVSLAGAQPAPLCIPNNAVRLHAVMSSTADGGGDGAEYLVLTNVSEMTATLAGVRITCAKTGKSPSLDLTLPGDLTLESGATMKLEKGTWWPAAKITNGAVDIVLSDAEGAVFQSAHVDASWWDGACDGTGAAFIAREFGDTVTERVQWRPSSTALPTVLRVCAVMSSTADDGGDGSEFIVLTNLQADAAVDLADARLTCGKTGAAAPSLVLALADTVPAGGTLTLTKAADWPAGKITNGKVDIVIVDAAGDTVQTLHVDASWWNKACDGTGAHFVATDFGATVTDDTQWRPSFTPPADKTVRAGIAGAVAADDRIRLWLDGLANGAAITAFAGDGDTLRACFLVGVDPETEPEIEVLIPEIGFAADGRVRVSGALTHHGAAKEGAVHGTINLYYSDTLEGLSTATEAFALGDTFPVPLQSLDLPAATSRFFKLKVE